MDNGANVSRREFLKDTALAGAGVAVLGGLAPAKVLGANDKIRIGAIGTGGRCQYLMKIFKNEPSVDLVAVCDVYGPHRDKALQIAGPDAKGYTNYHEVLAGKDAYLEKPIMHSIEEGVEMVRAVEETKRIVQTGTQQRSWPHWIM